MSTRFNLWYVGRNGAHVLMYDDDPVFLEAIASAAAAAVPGGNLEVLPDLAEPLAYAVTDV